MTTTRTDPKIDILALRQRLHLTQAALAQRLGVAIFTINRWETGKVRPSPLALQKIRELEDK